jgi:hypothetical protein
METSHVTALLRPLSAAVSRRGVCAALSSGLLATLGSPFGSGEAAAKQKNRHQKQRKKRVRRRKRNNRRHSLPPTAPSGPVVQVDATCVRPPEDSGLATTNPEKRLGQTFTALASGLLVQAELPISKISTSTGDYVLQLGTVDVAGVPTNAVLATTSVANTAKPPGTSLVAFTFASPASVVAGTTYALILSRPGSDDLVWFGHRGNTCSGRAFESANLTAPFEEAIVPDLDFSFTTFVSS